VIYDIRLRITYTYASPAAAGRHLACLMPLDIGAVQQVLAGSLDIAPNPAERTDRQDFFGNHVTDFSLRSPHRSISVTMTARVNRLAIPAPATPPLADLPGLIYACHDLGATAPHHFMAPSVRVPASAAITAFARKSVPKGLSVAEAVRALGHALHKHMKFDPKATTVDTPAEDAFAQRRGVCQDFSHIMIAGLRGLGVPAGYVSGFLRTLPPPGKPRLEGADAMHAWVRAWAGPQAGWIEFDPTNDMASGADHITVAHGRDYSDVAPIKGSLRISGGQKSTQSVDVIPLDVPDEVAGN
jgi:transglutaminase-like putative cysteine protease